MRRAGREAERGRGDVHADRARCRRRAVTENASSISVVAASSRLNACTSARGSPSGSGGSVDRRKLDAARKVLEEKAPEVIAVGRRQRAAALEQPRGRQAGSLARLLERLDLDAVAVRLVEQLRQQRQELRGQLEARERGGPFVDAQLLLALLLHRGERGLERVGRRGAVAALAAPIEVHRRAMQPHEDGRGLERRRRAAEVLARELLEAEFFGARSTPTGNRCRWPRRALRRAR